LAGDVNSDGWWVGGAMEGMEVGAGEGWDVMPIQGKTRGERVGF